MHDTLVKRDLLERDQISEIAMNFPTMRKIVNLDATQTSKTLIAQRIAKEFRSDSHLPENDLIVN